VVGEIAPWVAWISVDKAARGRLPPPDCSQLARGSARHPAWVAGRLLRLPPGVIPVVGKTALPQVILGSVVWIMPQNGQFGTQP